MPNTPSLQPDYLPGSYSDRNYEARRLFDQGEMDQAAAICQRIIDRISRLPERRRPHDSSLHQSLLAALILLAEIHAKQDNWPAVDDLCMRARTLLPVYAHRWAVEPFVLCIQYGRSQEGIDGLQALADSQPDSFYLWRMLAQAALDVDDLDLAMTASDHAEQIAEPDENIEDQDLVAHQVGRFRLFQQRGQWHEAALEWNSACVLDDEMEELREVVVRMFLQAGLYDDALDYVDDEVLGAALGDYYRGWVANRRGDLVRARYLWRKIVESDPAQEDNPTVRALAYCYLRQTDAALAVLLEAIGGGDAISVADALALALAWAMHGDVDAARANVRLAVKRSATARKPNPLLAALDWFEFEHLVQDQDIKAELRSFFEPSPS